MSDLDLGTDRRARLQAARLYLVCDVAPGGRELSEFLPTVISAGVDIVQLRDKQLADEQLTEVARVACEVCQALGALLIVNDRPAVAVAAGADGVHVGQEDMSVAQARALVGRDGLIGLSTHSPLQIDAATRLTPEDDPYVDYIGVGPVYATPTKPGRQPVGLELVSYASAHAHVPFFAIGGIDTENIDSVLDAGATRVCVLRAISAAGDPERAALALREALEQPALWDGDGRR